MNKLILAAALSALGAAAMAAPQANPLWLRNTAISPDGQTIAFTYRGDIYTVPAAGGRPRLLLSLPSDALSVDAQGRILYTDKKGFEDKFRKHEQSSGTSDAMSTVRTLPVPPHFWQAP